MAWENFHVSEPVLPERQVEIEVEQVPGHGDLPGLVIRSYRGGSQFGTCQSYSAGQRQRAEEAQDQFFVRWLGIDEGEQHRGWGRYLLHRTLWEMQEIGYKHSLISTGIHNHRALLFYTNYGYHVVDTTYNFSKSTCLEG